MRCCPYESQRQLLILQFIQIPMGSSALCCDNHHNPQIQAHFLQDPRFGVNLSAKSKQTYGVALDGLDRQQGKTSVYYPLKDHRVAGYLYRPGQYLYEGALSNYNAQGSGRVFMIDTGIYYEGGFQENRAYGEGQVEIVNSKEEQKKQIIKGVWERGFPKSLETQINKQRYTFKKINGSQGDQIQISYPDGRRFQGRINADLVQSQELIQGEGILYNTDQTVLSGVFKKGLLEGQGKITDHKNNKKRVIYQGNFQKGLFNGQGTFFFQDGEKLIINWIYNKPEGQGKIEIRGQTHNVVYQNGVRIDRRPSSIRASNSQIDQREILRRTSN